MLFPLHHTTQIFSCSIFGLINNLILLTESFHFSRALFNLSFQSYLLPHNLSFGHRYYYPYMYLLCLSLSTTLPSPLPLPEISFCTFLYVYILTSLIHCLKLNTLLLWHNQVAIYLYLQFQNISHFILAMLRVLNTILFRKNSIFYSYKLSPIEL